MSTGPDSPQPPQDPQPAGGPPPQPGYGQPPPNQPGAYQPGGYPQPGPPGPPGQPGQLAAMRPDEEKMWAIGAHLGGVVLGFIAPLVVWLVFKDRSAYLDRTGKEALNFQLTLLIGYAVSAVLVVVLIGLLTMLAVWLVGLLLMILATVKVANREDYRYPLCIRFIK